MRRLAKLLLCAIAILLLLPLSGFGPSAAKPPPKPAPQPFWSLEGNAGIDPTTDFLGTTDAQPLELRVNNTRALRLEPNGAFAAGPHALASHAGAFVWADTSSPDDFASTGADRFLVRAVGGVHFTTSGGGFLVDGHTVWHQGNHGSASGLDADLLDGQESTAFAAASHDHSGDEITSGTVAEGYIDADIARDGEVMPTVLANDGSGSGLNADLLDGQDSTAYQARVSGACGVGSTIRAINADGTVVCQTDAPFNRSAVPIGNAISTVDSAGNVGVFPSVTIGADGLGLISYRDSTNGDLKVAHCSDLACTSATVTTVDSVGDVGEFTSVTIGADGLGLISYYDVSPNYDLKVAHCEDLACTAATVTTVDSAGHVGGYTSVTIGADGLGLISYFDRTNYDLKVAHCNDLACTSAISTTLDSAGHVGTYTSVTIGADGLGLISYHDSTNNDLKVAHCNDLACTTATLATLDSAGFLGEYTSVTIGADGLGLISYHENLTRDLKVAHCNDVACTSATLHTLDTAHSVGWLPSVTIGADGLGLISYHNDTHGELKVAHCNDLACTSATVHTLDSAGDVGSWSSVTIGADGLPLISYYDSSNKDLKVAHCSNAFCVPYFRRR